MVSKSGRSEPYNSRLQIKKHATCGCELTNIGVVSIIVIPGHGSVQSSSVTVTPKQRTAALPSVSVSYDQFSTKTVTETTTEIYNFATNIRCEKVSW